MGEQSFKLMVFGELGTNKIADNYSKAAKTFSVLILYIVKDHPIDS